MKFVHPLVLFLDEDLETSARYLENLCLEQGIKNSCQILMCSIYYLLGFRTKTIFKHYFSKDRWDDTRMKYFVHYPLKHIPKYTFYNSPEARWCRKCSNHYKHLQKYLKCMLDEHAFRYGREHELADMGDFLSVLPMELAVRHGRRFPNMRKSYKLQLPWKNLPPKYRKKDIIAGYRAYYKAQIYDPLSAFNDTRRDVPEFLMENRLELQ